MSRPTTEKVWSTGRQIMGNLLPSLICLPFLVVALLLFKPAKPLDPTALWWFAAFPAVGWLALNQFGFFQNAFMRRELARRLGFVDPKSQQDLVFVGIARPKYRSILDPHEDVGFLAIHPDRLEFMGETVQVDLSRKNVTRIRMRMNPHTLVLLGQWISVEGQVGLTPVRLLIEPREKTTLLGNLLYSRHLKARLEAWLAAPEAQANTTQ